MPAALPGSTASANGTGNPSAGAWVIFDPLSGPKGSPFDTDEDGNASTGALQTGIGYGAWPMDTPVKPSFTDDYVPGQSNPASVDTMDSTYMYIGGGRSDVAGVSNPYDTGSTPICGAGNGGSRDGGTAAPYTGFPMKTVTASGTVANGAAVETGFLNRTGVSVTAGQSTFGSSTTAATAPT